jgi:hypothetical protein
VPEVVAFEIVMQNMWTGPTVHIAHIVYGWDT